MPEAAVVVDAAADMLRPPVGRSAAHRPASAYLRGLLAEVARKNGGQLAEQAGYRHPRGSQRVLDRSVWDHDAVRADRRRSMVAELGDPTGILVVAETGVPTPGTHWAGGARQYCGTLGKMANCQVGVFLGYASAKGYVALDREVVLPQAWCTDRERRRRAGIAEQVEHQTKPQRARMLLERALDAGVPAAWVTGAEVSGSDSKLRRALAERRQRYVLAVRSNQDVRTWPPYGAPGQTTVAAVLATVPRGRVGTTGPGGRCGRRSGCRRSSTLCTQPSRSAPRSSRTLWCRGAGRHALKRRGAWQHDPRMARCAHSALCPSP